MDPRLPSEKQDDVARMMNKALETEGLRKDEVPNVFREEMEGKPKRNIESVGDIKEQEELDRRRAFPNRGGIGGAKEGEDLPKPREGDGGVTPFR